MGAHGACIQEFKSAYFVSAAVKAQGKMDPLAFKLLLPEAECPFSTTLMTALCTIKPSLCVNLAIENDRKSMVKQRSMGFRYVHSHLSCCRSVVQAKAQPVKKFQLCSCDYQAPGSHPIK